MKWELDLWYELWNRAGSQGLDTWYDPWGETSRGPYTGCTLGADSSDKMEEGSPEGA